MKREFFLLVISHGVLSSGVHLEKGIAFCSWLAILMATVPWSNEFLGCLPENLFARRFQNALIEAERARRRL